ncbi:MAG TPA: MFS transporter [Chloroflexia bacterium]|nr:MFS transporter [Chloroflexia bacterium]
METTLKEGQRELAISRQRLKLQLGLSFFSFIMIGANDGALGVLLPSIQAHYSIDKATLSLFFLASTAGYLIAAFSSGLLLEKLGQRLFLVLGPVAFLAAVILISFMPPFFLTLPFLLLLGFGIAIIDAGLNSYIAGLPRNSALLNYLHAFYGIGALIGPIVASTVIALNLGWNLVYILWAAFSLIVLVGFTQVFQAQDRPQHHAEAADGKNVLGMALKLRVVWLGAFFLLFYVGGEVSLGSWSYSFLTEDRHEAALLSGWAVSGYWLGLTLGRLVLGKVALRFGNKRLIQGCLVGVATGVLLIWLVPVGAVSAFGLILTGFSLGPIFPTTIALMSSLVSPRLLPSAIGFMTSLGSMGAAFFPWLAGNMAQAYGLWTLLPYVIILTVVMLFIWFALQKAPSTENAPGV